MHMDASERIRTLAGWQSKAYEAMVAGRQDSIAPPTPQAAMVIPSSYGHSNHPSCCGEQSLLLAVDGHPLNLVINVVVVSDRKRCFSNYIPAIGRLRFD